MSQHQEQGGASALPIANAFLSIGGRIMINPEGKLETGGNFAWMFSDTSPKDARRSYTISRRFYRRLRNPRFARSLKQITVEEGQRTENGWLVLEARS